jgi:hypothetical protein
VARLEVRYEIPSQRTTVSSSRRIQKLQRDREGDAPRVPQKVKEKVLVALFATNEVRLDELKVLFHAQEAPRHRGEFRRLASLLERFREPHGPRSIAGSQLFSIERSVVVRCAWRSMRVGGDVYTRKRVLPSRVSW